MESLLSAWALVFVMNAVTFPFPPAWTVLTAYYATGSVPLLPLTLGGSAAAAIGRMLFAWTIGRFTNRLSAEQRANAQALSEAAHRKLRWPWLFVVIYSFLPVPSDPVFVAVGLGALPWASTFIAFLLARSVFNTIMVVSARPVVANVADLLTGRFNWSSVLIVLATVAGYMLFLRLPWARWLGTSTPAPPSSPALSH
jgi:membrane protein YqaA with SNARE-associated domain